MYPIVTMLCWNKALWLDVWSLVNIFNQLECITSAQCSFATLEFVYDIDSKQY